MKRKAYISDATFEPILSCSQYKKLSFKSMQRINMSCVYCCLQSWKSCVTTCRDGALRRNFTWSAVYAYAVKDD
eukprot:10257106-Karenia_brevis.AAC.1